MMLPPKNFSDCSVNLQKDSRCSLNVQTCPRKTNKLVGSPPNGVPKQILMTVELACRAMEAAGLHPQLVAAIVGGNKAQRCGVNNSQAFFGRSGGRVSGRTRTLVGRSSTVSTKGWTAGGHPLSACSAVQILPNQESLIKLLLSKPNETFRGSKVRRFALPCMGAMRSRKR